jgi:hypothetical protein
MSKLPYAKVSRYCGQHGAPETDPGRVQLNPPELRHQAQDEHVEGCGHGPFCNVALVGKTIQTIVYDLVSYEI